jgi:glucokinase
MYIGFDIGGTHIKGILIDKKGNTLDFNKINTRRTASDIEDSIIGIVEKFSASAIDSRSRIRAIGIGAAGAIDKKNGLILTSPNIRAWKRYPLVGIVEKKTGIRTFLENDATAAVMGEWWKGNGRNFRNWIMLTLGTGIGGGAVIDNKIYTGQSGSAMEFGHMTIDYKGKRCACGNRGCLELYASATAIVRSARSGLRKYKGSSVHKRLKSEKLSSKLIYEEAVKGDVFSKKIFNDTAEFLGIGISNLISIFNPEAVIIGGGLSRAHKLIIPVVKQVVRERVQEGLKENISYLLIKDEEKIPALGAAKLAFDSL